MGYSVRRLGAGDLIAFRALNYLFGEVFEEPDNYHDHPPSDGYCEQLLSDPGVFLVVAETDGNIIGGLAGYIWRKFEQERNEAYIYDLAVIEEYRRQGVATALINEVRSIARETGSWVVIIESEEGDEVPTRLYRKLANHEEMAHHFNIKP